MSATWFWKSTVTSASLVHLLHWLMCHVKIHIPTASVTVCCVKVHTTHYTCCYMSCKGLHRSPYITRVHSHTAPVHVNVTAQVAIRHAEVLTLTTLTSPLAMHNKQYFYGSYLEWWGRGYALKDGSGRHSDSITRLAPWEFGLSHGTQRLRQQRYRCRMIHDRYGKVSVRTSTWCTVTYAVGLQSFARHTMTGAVEVYYRTAYGNWHSEDAGLTQHTATDAAKMRDLHWALWTLSPTL